MSILFYLGGFIIVAAGILAVVGLVIALGAKDRRRRIRGWVVFGGALAILIWNLYQLLTYRHSPIPTLQRLEEAMQKAEAQVREIEDANPFGGDSAFEIEDPPTVNGQKQGVQKEFWVVGGRRYLSAEVPYVNGKKHGIAKTYDDKGNLVEEEPWVNGETQGELRMYYPGTGHLRAVLPYVAGWPEGHEVWYYPSGQVQCEVDVVEGTNQAKSVCKDENGSVIAEGVYRDGKMWDGAFLDWWGKNPAESERWNWAIVRYEGGKQQGETVWTDKDGKVVARGTYKNGKMWDGTFVVTEGPLWAMTWVVKRYKRGVEK